jgi:hypothetical protein
MERPWFRSRLFAHNPSTDAIERQLSATIDREFDELLKAYGDGNAPKRKIIELADERLAA